MKLFDDERDVLPAWVTSKQAANLPELKSIKKTNKIFLPMETTAEIRLEFESHRTIGVAVELLNVAIIENDRESAYLAASYLSEEGFVPPNLAGLIKKAIGSPEVTPSPLLGHPVSKLKKLLESSPNNPLAWADLSREYAILGEKDKSIKAMLGALHAGVDHRWISRVASRVFVHFGEPDRAHHVLLKNEYVKSDPWLLATEMAVSRKAEKQSKLLSIGKRLLESNIKPMHTSELASSFGTLELINGAEKKAKKLFKQSLVEPNQNSLAQAKWAERSSSIKKLIQVPLNTQLVAYEAQYWEAYSNKDIPLALGYAMAWYEQEPYSTGPAIAASYLASLLDHYELVALVANKGLIANPHNPTLKLNQIFAWIAKSNLSELSAATLVEVEQAYRDLNDMVASNDWSISAHALANLGMLEYRLGDNERGRMRYEEAARIYEKNSPEFIILLLVNYLREALICDPDWAYEVMSRTKLALLGNSSSATPGGEYYLDKIFRLSSLPGTWRDKFRSESTRAMQAAQSPSTGVENRTLSVDAALSKFWLPKSFSRIESLSQFTDNADDSRKPPKC